MYKLLLATTQNLFTHVINIIIRFISFTRMLNELKFILITISFRVPNPYKKLRIGKAH